MKCMHKIICGLLLCSLALTSCEKDGDEPGISGSLTVDREEILVGPDRVTEKVTISASEKIEWVASSSTKFVYTTPANGTGSAQIEFVIDSTLESGSRTAQVRIMNRNDNSERRIVNITQFGYGKQILLKEPDVEIESSGAYDDRYIKAMVTTNVAFKVVPEVVYELGEELTPGDDATLSDGDLKDWIRIDDVKVPSESDQEEELDRKDRPRSFEIRIPWNMNTIPYTRIAKIRLAPIDPDVELVDQEGKPTGEVILTVRQEAAQHITDDRAGDSLVVVMINEKIQSMVSWDTSENMTNWDVVTLWEESDEDLPEPEAVGRVRSVLFSMFNMQEGEIFPRELRYLKYLESFTLQSNENRQLREMEMGSEVCELEHLKKLTIDSYGLIRLPDDFVRLGGTLEELNLSSNNFTSLTDLTSVVNKTNFPKLKVLRLAACRRNDTMGELNKQDQGQLTSGELGMYLNLNTNKQALIELLKWDALERLNLAYNLFEGELPSDEEMAAAGFTTYKATAEAEEKYPILQDTCRWLLTDREVELPGMNRKVKGSEVLCVLPKARSFSINLNFLTGDIPDWILFHPYFVEWNPESLIFTQWENGKDSQGNSVGFDNIRNNSDFGYGYYYGNGKEADRSKAAYPMYYNKFVGGGDEGGVWPDLP
ncbi:MAG: hypothetical protein LUF83_07335 [Alistipes sp.]|nr:hypothetical protein [Alistipes sp.]